MGIFLIYLVKNIYFQSSQARVDFLLFTIHRYFYFPPALRKNISLT